VTASGREPFVQALWGVRYQVSDVQRSIAFHTHTLGLSLDRENPPAFGRSRWRILTAIRSNCSNRPAHSSGAGTNRLLTRTGYCPAFFTVTARKT
jgi:hypothetical protein